METGAKVLTDHGVWVTGIGSSYEFFEADTIIVATGTRPVKSLAEMLKARVPALYVIGEALSPRKVKEAIEEGLLTAFES